MFRFVFEFIGALIRFLFSSILLGNKKTFAYFFYESDEDFLNGFIGALFFIIIILLLNYVVL